MEYKEFDPERYPEAFEKSKLFEMQTERTEEKISTKLVKVTSEEIYEEAKAVPWLFAVEVE